MSMDHVPCLSVFNHMLISISMRLPNSCNIFHGRSLCVMMFEFACSCHCCCSCQLWCGDWSPLMWLLMWLITDNVVVLVDVLDFEGACWRACPWACVWSEWFHIHVCSCASEGFWIVLKWFWMVVDDYSVWFLLLPFSSPSSSLVLFLLFFLLLLILILIPNAPPHHTHPHPPAHLPKTGGYLDSQKWLDQVTCVVPKC